MARFAKGDRVRVRDWSYMKELRGSDDVEISAHYASEPWKSQGEHITLCVIQTDLQYKASGYNYNLDLIIEDTHGRRFRTGSDLVVLASPSKLTESTTVTEGNMQYLLLG